MMAINFLNNSISFLFICLIAPLWGQTQKKYVSEKEYEQWTSMSAATLSPNGNWAYYTLSNTHIKGMTQPDKPADTLELAELKNMKKHIYPLGLNPQFAPNGTWFSFFQNDQWVLFDLTNKTETRTDSIRSAQFALNGEVTLIRHTNHPDKLTVYSNKNKSGLTINHTKDFSISPNKENMVVLQQSENLFSLLLLDLKKPDRPTLLKENLNNCSNFRWSDSGNLVAFYEETKNGIVDYKDHLLHCINLKDRTKDKFLYSGNIKGNFHLNKSSIVFTSDEKSINFTAFPIDSTPEIVDPLIWKSSDPIQPPQEIIYPKNKIHRWNMDSNQIKKIGSDNFQLLSSGDFNHFFTLENSNYMPSHKFSSFYNDIFFCKNDSTQTRMIEKKFTIFNRADAISISPKGNYFAWIKDKNWWLYDIKKNDNLCITCNSNSLFSIPLNDKNTPYSPYGTIRYSNNNNTIILTSENNIYLYDISSNTLKALFPQNRKNAIYKIEQESMNHGLGVNYIFGIKAPVDLVSGILITEFNPDTQREKLFLYKQGEKPQLITSTTNRISSPRKVGNTIIYTVSNYNLPPRIVYWKNSKETIVKQSNKQQQNYYWGHSELLTYPGPYGTTLKGALFYPGNYNPDKKYPVIFKIYTDISLNALKEYSPLTFQNSTGWNNSLFTTQDYFVFMPDIAYKTNYTGESALKSVQAGVDAISEIPSVDTTNMALFGHSFGGYEASYIATQTDIFKTVICSAGIHNLISYYLSVDSSKLLNYFQFRYHLIRINASFLSQTFINNSPIFQADKINTPLLLIAGTNDFRVNSKNSMEMQIALTELGKNSTLLLYPKENHVFTKKVNQLDISKKLLEFLNYHLKNKTKPVWL